MGDHYCDIGRQAKNCELLECGRDLLQFIITKSMFGLCFYCFYCVCKFQCVFDMRQRVVSQQFAKYCPKCCQMYCCFDEFSTFCAYVLTWQLDSFIGKWNLV